METGSMLQLVLSLQWELNRQDPQSIAQAAYLFPDTGKRTIIFKTAIQHIVAFYFNDREPVVSFNDYGPLTQALKSGLEQQMKTMGYTLKGIRVQDVYRLS